MGYHGQVEPKGLFPYCMILTCEAFTVQTLVAWLLTVPCPGSSKDWHLQKTQVKSLIESSPFACTNIIQGCQQHPEQNSSSIPLNTCSLPHIHTKMTECTVCKVNCDLTMSSWPPPPEPETLPLRRPRTSVAWEHHNTLVLLQVSLHPDLEIYCLYWVLCKFLCTVGKPSDRSQQLKEGAGWEGQVRRGIKYWFHQ